MSSSSSSSGPAKASTHEKLNWLIHASYVKKVNSPNRPRFFFPHFLTSEFTNRTSLHANGPSKNSSVRQMDKVSMHCMLKLLFFVNMGKLRSL
jgi:hypothetical protein